MRLLLFPLLSVVLYGQTQLDYVTQVRNAPTYDVRKFAGADLGAQINACVAALPSTGGTCDTRGFAAGTYVVGTTVTLNKPVELLLGGFIFQSQASPAFAVSGDSDKIVGMGMQGTVILSDNIHADIFYITGRFADISQLTTRAKNIKVSGASFHLDRNLGCNSTIHDVRMEGTYEGITDNAGGTIIRNIQAGPAQGPAAESWKWMIYIGTPADPTHTTPSGTIENVALNINVNVTDAAIVLESGCDTIRMKNIDIGTGGGAGTALSIRNSINNPATFNTPRWIQCTNCSFEGGYSVTGIDITHGNDIKFNNFYLSGQQTGVRVHGNGINGVHFTHGVAVSINQSAFSIEQDLADVTIEDTRFSDLSLAADNTYPAINIADGVGYVKILNNTFMNGIVGYTQKPNYDVLLGTNSHHVWMTGNAFTTYGTAAYLNNSSFHSFWIGDNSDNTAVTQAHRFENAEIGTKFHMTTLVGENGYGTPNLYTQDLMIGVQGDPGNAEAVSMAWGDGSGWKMTWGSNDGLGGTYVPKFTWYDNGGLVLKKAIGFVGVPFASISLVDHLGQGTLVYCTDCTEASNPCSGGGTGTFAMLLPGKWKCF